MPFLEGAWRRGGRAVLNHGQLSAESLLPHQGGSCHSGDLNLDEVGGLGGKGCVVPWPVLGDAATESVSLLASPSLLQQTFMKALSLFQIPQNVVCILHAPYPSPWGGGRNVYHGAPLRALSGSSHSAINVNSVLAGSWGRPDSACGGPLGERALHSRCSPSHVKYVSLLTAGAARLVRGSCEASCRLASFRGGAGGDRPVPRSWLPSVPAPPHTLSDFQWAFHRLNVPLIFVEVDGGKLGRLLRQWRCALRPPRSRRPALGGPSRSLL